MYRDKNNEMNTNRAIQKVIMKTARLSFCALTLSLSLLQVGWSRRHIINIQKMSVDVSARVWAYENLCVIAGGATVCLSIAILHGSVHKSDYHEEKHC